MSRLRRRSRRGKGDEEEATEQSLAHARERSRTITTFITHGWAPRRRRLGSERLTRNNPSSMLDTASSPDLKYG